MTPAPPGPPLHRLAHALGIARAWRDVEGRDQIVRDAALARIATALGYPAGSDHEITASLAALESEANRPPRMLVTEVGRPTPLPQSLARAQLITEDGTARELDLTQAVIPPIDTPGYHRLVLAGHALTLAVAPRRCPSPAPPRRDGAAPTRLWGPAIQIPALRQGPSAGPDKDLGLTKPYGTLAELAEAVDLFAARGADAIAVNPLHALFAGEGHRYSPYSPSSRQHFNTAFAAPELLGMPPLDWSLQAVRDADADAGADLIDWENALPRQQALLDALFRGLDEATRARFEAATANDEDLRRHALFDALDVHFRSKGLVGWRNWPAAYHDPDGDAVAQVARRNPGQIAFHMFTQWLTREGLARVQARAQAAGMAIGLVGDLAVGVHIAGADSWTLQGSLLDGLTIGAPPDPLGPLGQNWNLTSFSPQGLVRTGYAPWIAMLRAALSRTGALRIDHAFGMARLWVIPEGGSSQDGAYLSYPFEDLLRLAVLEAYRANAILIAENLGTAPFGFLGALEERRLLDMRVLWFERAADDGFIGAGDYPSDAVAMTGTHDTATLAGWWTGRDLDWAEKLGRLPEGTSPEAAAERREWDRGLLWASLTHDEAPRPSPEDPAPVVEAALAHIGRTPSVLAIAPLEDLLCEVEQPNLPGTVTEHPNWRRRSHASLASLLDDPATQARLAALDTARKAPPDPPSGG